MHDNSQQVRFRFPNNWNQSQTKLSARHFQASQTRKTNMASMKAFAIGLGAGAGAIVATVGVPVVLGAVGFTSAGIAAGSYAASMMSAAAVANGGGVAAGSTVAVLQSIGAAGLSGGATAAISGAGAAVGWLVSLFGKKSENDEGAENNDDNEDEDKVSTDLEPYGRK